MNTSTNYPTGQLAATQNYKDQPRDLQVQERMKQLEDAMARQNELLSNLESRLSCVIRSEPSPGMPSSPEKPKCFVPLAGAIDRVVDGANTSNDRLRILLSLLEL